MKAKKQEKLVRVGNTRCQEMHITDAEDSKEGKLQSILERNALDEFLTTAVMAGKDFTAERNMRIVENTGEEGDESLRTMGAKRWQAEDYEQLRIPKRPRWENKGLTAEQLDRLEKDSFLDWRRGLAEAEEASSSAITPFEKNLEVWRQLWRVVERSDVVVQIVDARNPLLFRCEDLGGYVDEIGKRQRRVKKHVLLLNKADFLPLAARKLWKQYFDKQGIPFIFWSAYQAEIDLKEQEKELKQSGSSMEHDKPSIDDTNDLDSLEISASQVRVFSRREILAYFEIIGKQAVAETKKAYSSDQTAKARRYTGITIGMIGYPNVGKSSTVNVLMGEKKVAVSATAGKTKHFQTLIISEGLTLCDCPGLVFPTFMRSNGALAASGVYPLAQLRDYNGAVAEVVARITRQQLQNLYGLTFPTNKPVTPAILLDSHATMRGFMKDHGRPDSSRSARIVLSDFVNGHLLYCHPPPGISPLEMRSFLLAVQGVGDEHLSVQSNLESSEDSFPKVREVWGVLPKDYKRVIAEAQSEQSQRSENVNEDLKLPKNGEAEVDLGNLNSMQVPLAAGEAVPTQRNDLDDDGLLEELVEEGKTGNQKRRPNTNKKMSKRERRRLRKQNKMESMLRRDAAGAAKRQLIPST